MSAIFKREFKAYFTTPIGYIVLFAFYAFLGLLFYGMYASGAPDIVSIISGTNIISYFFIPILTMRLMCEDRRQKVDQALLTAPIKLYEIVFGKFLAAFAVFALAFAPTVIYEIIFAALVKVNVLSYIYSLFGMWLLGGALISIGMFISCLTESSAVSAILSIVINIVVMLMPTLAGLVKSNATFGWLGTVLENFSFISRAENFNKNILSIADIIYFLSIIAIFTFLSIRSLEKRRWS